MLPYAGVFANRYFSCASRRPKWRHVLIAEGVGRVHVTSALVAVKRPAAQVRPANIVKVRNGDRVYGAKEGERFDKNMIRSRINMYGLFNSYRSY